VCQVPTVGAEGRIGEERGEGSGTSPSPLPIVTRAVGGGVVAWGRRLAIVGGRGRVATLAGRRYQTVALAPCASENSPLR
jgi:hypothetical protein